MKLRVLNRPKELDKKSPVRSNLTLASDELNNDEGRLWLWLRAHLSDCTFSSSSKLAVRLTLVLSITQFI